jgi:hypothetical protein
MAEIVLWVSNLSLGAMALAVFGSADLLAGCIFLIVMRLATGECATLLK